jgi:hypothetical protein
MTSAELAFAGIVGAISALGLILSGILTARATARAAELSAREMNRQIVLSSMATIAEFRQAWINNLRDAMAKFIALGVDLTRHDIPKMAEQAAKIQLLMNRNDARYERLVDSLSDYIKAAGSEGSELPSKEFVELCQDVLKSEWEVLKKQLLHLDV